MRASKVLTRVSLIALMLALPVVVSASHQFTDVPTSHTFHAAIANVYGARLTTGCTTTKFCPDANVTRGQMAAFLNRGLGRAGAKTVEKNNNGWQDILESNPSARVPVARVLLMPGGAPRGAAHVWVDGTVSLWTAGVGVCPCEVQAYIIADSGGRSEQYFGMIGSDLGPPDPDDTTPRRYATTTLSISHLFTVASGAGNVFDLYVRVIPTKAPALVSGAVSGYRANVQALYVPFGFDGTKAIFPEPPMTTVPPTDNRP